MSPLSTPIDLFKPISIPNLRQKDISPAHLKEIIVEQPTTVNTKPLAATNSTGLSLAETLKVGWMGYGVTLINLLARGIRDKEEAMCFSALAGIACAATKVYQGKLTKPEPTKAQTLAGSSLYGLAFGASVLSTWKTIEMLSNSSYKFKDAAFFLAAGSSLALGINRSAKSFVENKRVSKTIPARLLGIAGSISKIFPPIIATVGMFMTADVLHALKVSQNLDVVITTSAIAAIVSGIDHYYFHEAKNDDPNKKIRNKLIVSLQAGFERYAIGFAGSVALAALFGKNINQYLARPYMTFAALAGTRFAIRNFLKNEPINSGTDANNNNATSPKIDIKLTLSKLSQKWRSLSKVKKSGVIFTALSALTALGIQQIGIENIQAAAQAAAKVLYDKSAFKIKTLPPVTKSLNGWVADYSDSEELNRLASLTVPNEQRDLEDFPLTCAEILQTCDLDAESMKEHKDVYKKKFKKFHPDKYPNPTRNPEIKKLAEQASQALSMAQDFMKKEGVCSGKDDWGCQIGEQEITMQKILKKPYWWSEKFMKEKETCTLVTGNEGSSQETEVSLDYCNDINIITNLLEEYITKPPHDLFTELELCHLKNLGPKRTQVQNIIETHYTAMQQRHKATKQQFREAFDQYTKHPAFRKQLSQFDPAVETLLLKAIEEFLKKH